MKYIFWDFYLRFRYLYWYILFVTQAFRCLIGTVFRHLTMSYVCYDKIFAVSLKLLCFKIYQHDYTRYWCILWFFFRSQTREQNYYHTDIKYILYNTHSSTQHSLVETSCFYYNIRNICIGYFLFFFLYIIQLCFCFKYILEFTYDLWVKL